MAEAAAEPQTAAPEQKVQGNKPSEATNGGAEKTNGSDDKSAVKSEKTDDDHRHPDRRGSRDEGDKDDRRDKRDSRDNRDRRDGGRDDRRGGGRGRGRGRFNGPGRGRGGNDRRGGGGYQRERNVRTRFEREEESNDAGEMRRQVEFYFSDSNLPIDKYLLQQTGGHENKPFPLKSIHSFKRMRHFQPFSALVEAVKGSEFLEVNDQDEVFRKVPLDEKFSQDPEANNEMLTSETIKRSIYAKGFGEEQEKTAFEIEEFFQPYGVRSVRLRRQQNGTFKGSVFVEFEDEDAAKQFLDMEDKPQFNDKDLIVKSKKDYIDEKSQGILDGSVKPRSPTRSGFSNRRGGRNGGDFKRKRNYDDDADEDVEDQDNWRDRRDKFQKDGRGRGRGRGRGNDRRGGRDRDDSVSQSRSRSRSPYREEKKESTSEETKPEETKKENETSEVKDAEKTEA